MRLLPCAPAIGALACLILATAATPAVAQAGAPAPLARFVPSEDLIFYAEFEGLDAHAGPWRKSAAYRLLNETTLGALLEDLAAQGFDRAASQGEPANVVADRRGAEADRTGEVRIQRR